MVIVNKGGFLIRFFLVVYYCPISAIRVLNKYCLSTREEKREVFRRVVNYYVKLTILFLNLIKLSVYFITCTQQWSI